MKNQDPEFQDMTISILPEEYNVYDLSFKVIVIGDSFVGKSGLTLMGTKNIYLPNYISTIGFDFCSFGLKIEDKVIKLQVWDTCGQESYRSLVVSFYRSCSCAIIVFAINE